MQYVTAARPKLTNVKRIENYSHTRKTKEPKHGIDSGLECALEVFEQPRRTRGSKKTLYRICQLLRNVWSSAWSSKKTPYRICREWNNCPLLKSFFSCYLKIWRERAGRCHSPKSSQHVTPETLCQTGGYRLKSQTFLIKNQEFAFRFEREDALFVFSGHGKTKSVL